MNNEEKILGDAIASIVEKILMKIDIVSYTKVGDILASHNLEFTDCYKNPKILGRAIKEVFGNDYSVIIGKIKTELSGLEDENQNLAKFIQELGK